jgi:hypothetical protein
MNRRLLCVVLAVAVVAGLSLSPAGARGRCRATLADTYNCQVTATDGTSRVIVLFDRRCRAEGRVCSQDGGECTTLFRVVDCLQEPDGNPGQVRVGLGCFCGGGSVAGENAHEDPVSAEEFLRIQEALESEDGDAGTCPAPASLPLAAE